MSILLTGGTGFIGSHTAVELINAGYEVVIADDLSNSSVLVVDRIETITGVRPGFHEIDVSDRDKVRKIFSDHKIDGVIHFAGYKSVPESTSVPLKYYRNNLATALSVLEVMEEKGCRTFVFSSSATVYGSENQAPYNEEMPTGEATNPYGTTKLMIENIVADYAKANKDFSGVLLRYFNPIGAHVSGLIGEAPNGIPNNLIPYVTQTAIGKREKLFVYGNDYDTPDGTGIRDYIHVADLAKGHVCALDYAMKHSGLEKINLGTGRGYSVLEVVNSFMTVTGVDVPYEIAARRPGDIAVSFADVSKARTMLGWQAQYGIDDMCAHAWNWQKNNPNGYE